MRKEIGKRIRMFRVVQGFTQEQLAERSGCRQSTVSRLESGAQVPDTEMLTKLARALRCSVADLVPEDGDAPYRITIRPA